MPENSIFQLSTFRGSLRAFLVNFDDRFLLDRDIDNSMKITDGSICRFLVAITRAKERVCIYTGKNEYPTYVEWITDAFIDDCT
ncbi:MAG: hypothetical protein AB2L12_13150 [Smithellaceae bacterium]